MNSLHFKEKINTSGYISPGHEYSLPTLTAEIQNILLKTIQDNSNTLRGHQDISNTLRGHRDYSKTLRGHQDNAHTLRGPQSTEQAERSQLHLNEPNSNSTGARSENSNSSDVLRSQSADNMCTNEVLRSESSEVLRSPVKEDLLRGDCVGDVLDILKYIYKHCPACKLNKVGGKSLLTYTYMQILACAQFTNKSATRLHVDTSLRFDKIATFLRLPKTCFLFSSEVLVLLYIVHNHYTIHVKGTTRFSVHVFKFTHC